MNSECAKGITWNLGDLYDSIQSQKLDQDLTAAEKKAMAFKEKYRPLLEEISTQSEKAALFPIESFLKDYKDIIILMTKPSVFSHLNFSGNSKEAENGAFMQKIQTRLTDIQSHLLFFDCLWNRLPDTTAAAIIESAATHEDRHFLDKLRTFAPYTLSECEENILSVKANTSSRAFSRLFDETMNNLIFDFEENHKITRKTKSEILSYSHSPDREIRMRASHTLADGLKNHSRLITYVYNMIMADHRSSLKLRNYQHPMDPMNLSNEIDHVSVMNLIQSIKKGYSLAVRFYRLKRRLLGLSDFYDYDRYAPLETDTREISFDQCREIVLSGYYEFAPEIGKIAQRFFDERWIDAEIRDGKHGGGFCAQTTPDLHPYILVNYTGNIRDVMTVAHELGHGLHQYLASRRVGILEADAPLTMAETASVFGEMIIFEKLLNCEPDPQKRLGLICGKIDDQFATVFRQIVLTDFELKAHSASFESGELSENQLNHFWIESNHELYQDSVQLTEDYQHGWKYIPHFIHSPFYCYAYSFAQLFVLSLFKKYKDNPRDFIPRYIEMLSLGGSRKPEVLAKMMELNLQAPDFWQAGLNLLEQFVIEAEELSRGTLSGTA